MKKQNKKRKNRNKTRNKKQIKKTSTFHKILNIIFKFIHILFLIILLILFVASLYMKYKFPNETIDELYFYMTNGVGNSDADVFVSAIKECFLFTVVLIFIVVGIFYNYLVNKKLLIKIVGKKKSRMFQIYPFKLVNSHKIIFTFILTIVSIFLSLNNMKIFEYFKNNIVSSDFIEANYVYPEKTKVSFNKKNNLIMIFVESLEMTFFTKEHGGDWDYEVIPELYDLMFDEDSVYFASDNKVGGMLNLVTTTWTTGSVVSNTSALPFKIPIDANEYHSDNFMNGAYTLGDFLKDNGYYNELITAAYSDFGGIKEYFSKHGSYNIIDVNNLKNIDLKMKSSDNGPWGFNDRYMFKIAKERLNKLSKKSAPFNLTLIGIDTHFPDGFKGEYTVDKYDTQYENVYRTESILINDFVKWVKNQDFYDDTTIVIVGDHLSMQEDFFVNKKQSKRRRYFLIINSQAETKNYKNRIYTSLDTYPTVLAAIGAEIEGNKLGLGVNLFSMRKTLGEKESFNYINKEIAKKSNFYNKNILGKDYEKMIESLGNIVEE